MDKKINLKFWATQHAQQRYIERVKNGLNTSNNVAVEILKLISLAEDVTDKIFNQVPRYILYLHENYGNCNYKIMEKDNIIFLCKKREGTEKLFEIITCFLSSSNYLSQFKNTVLTREEIFLKIKAIKKKNKL